MKLRPRSFGIALMAASLAIPAGTAFGQSAGYAQPGYSQPAYGQQGYVAPKPKGGCLKYGAAGAVGGHFAHHHAVLGAMGGCVAGAYVKHRSKASIRATGQP